MKHHKGVILSVFLSFLIAVNGKFVVAQKHVADTSSFDKWVSVADPVISNDGRYASYVIPNQPLNSRTCVLQSISGNWKIELPGIGGVTITEDCREAVYKKEDSLLLLRLGSSSVTKIPSVADFKLVKLGKKEWLLYRVKFSEENNPLVIYDINKRVEKKLKHSTVYKELPESNAIAYCESIGGISSLHWIDLNKNIDDVVWNGAGDITGIYSLTAGTALIYEVENKKDAIKSLYYLKCHEQKTHQIWSSGLNTNLSEPVLDSKREQFAFVAQNPASNAIWYFKPGFDRAVKKVEETDPLHDTTLSIISSSLMFSKDDNSIFFQEVEKAGPPMLPEGAVNVNLWSYTDIELQVHQLGAINPDYYDARKYQMVFNLATNKTIRLQGENEAFEEWINPLANSSNYVLIKHGGGQEFWWQENARSSVYLVNIKDGSRVLLKEKIPYPNDWYPDLNFKLSPNEKFVIYYDPLQGQYFSYEISTKITRDITSSAGTSFTAEKFEHAPAVAKLPEGFVGWMNDDRAFLVYDNYDIWQVDPLGKQKPVCITNGYGKDHQIRLRLAQNLDEENNEGKGALLLSGFDPSTKDNGFFRISLDEKRAPERLNMDPYLYYAPGALRREQIMPVKAKNANIWIVSRQSAEQAPNYFVTADFKNYRPISEIHPERNYNWLTTELIHWTALDGLPNTGILFKPENFDSTKKYPVIFNYFQERSNELHEYKKPDWTRDNINIPYFVSKGYIVCLPDTRSPKTELAQGGGAVVNSVFSAANYLSTMRWVDSKHMGIQGHSFGGSSTIALITHTGIFAAAAEGAGTSDGLSSYLQLTGFGTSRMNADEIGLGSSTPGNGIAGSLWERKESFYKSNNILSADLVTTPLLMMHNKQDGAVPWEQAVELYLSLRRLGKRVWWLQYDGMIDIMMAHFVNGESAKDYTIRMTQFFDHYLKGMPPPKWMTEGIPARKKGIETGYELDTSGKIPEEQKVLWRGKMQKVSDAVDKN